MKKISLKFLYPLLALVLLIIAMNRKILMIPPLNSLLNPFTGVVQNEKKLDHNLYLNYGIKDSIEILFEERQVPHVFSINQKDLFFAQGYVTAANRLWQMDFLASLSAGRLSEIFGEDLLDYDRSQRRSGIPSSAKTSLELIEAQSETKFALDNYTKGVNMYIKQLKESDLPVEYKMIGYSPEPWTNLKSVLIMKYMGALLSGYQEDASSSYLLAALGKNEYNKLFPSYFIDDTKMRPTIDRIIDSSSFDSYINFSFLESCPYVSDSIYNPRLGSNSWAISPKKSASGTAILCNDPHLNLSLPAVWYEIQLCSDETNVYGYSIPGTPGVIIGYNQNISWGLTNGSVDVCDLFKLELKQDYSQYKFDGIWKNTERTIEEIKIKNSKPFFDTIFHTIHGPISSDFRFGDKKLIGLATNWTLFDPSNEFLAFIKLNKASNYKEFKEAITYYKCPVQNFTYADVEGNIASHLQGKILKSRWSGRSKFILDGSRSNHLPSDVLTYELPFSHNPSNGFVFSANNNPFNQNDSFYVSGHYSEVRSSKIKQLLSQNGKFTLKDMKLMQLDNTNRLAELAIPVLINFIPAESSVYAKKLKEWDCKCSKESEMAFVFEQWWARIKDNTWDELKRFQKADKLPDDLTLLDLISNDPNNKYFDKLSTNKKETAEDIVKLSFTDFTQSSFMIPMKWEDYHKVDINHLLSIPAFNEKIYSSGHPNAINAMSDNWGPSMRLIVEMTRTPQGYGIYAGGQSGNPASKEYRSFIDDWENGKYYKLNFFLNKAEAKSKTSYKWVIK